MYFICFLKILSLIQYVHCTQECPQEFVKEYLKKKKIKFLN